MKPNSEKQADTLPYTTCLAVLEALKLNPGVKS